MIEIMIAVMVINEERKNAGLGVKIKNDQEMPVRMTLRSSVSK